MDEIYRDHRISIRTAPEGWVAKVWTVRGHLTPATARASEDEGRDVCCERARRAVDHYIEYVRRH